LKDINDTSLATTERKSVARNSLSVNTSRQARLSVGSTISDIGSIPTVSPLSSVIPGESYDWNPTLNKEQVSFPVPSRARLSLKNDTFDTAQQRTVLENIASVTKNPRTVYDNDLSDLVGTTKMLQPADLQSSRNDTIPSFVRGQSDNPVYSTGIVKNRNNGNNNPRTVYDVDLNDESPKQMIKETPKELQGEPTFLRTFQKRELDAFDPGIASRERQDSVFTGKDDIISDFVVAPVDTKNERISNPTWLSTEYGQRSNEKNSDDLVNLNTMKQREQDEIIGSNLTSQSDGFQPKKFNLPTWLQSKGSS
jgi:hypothetical protein